MFHDAYGWQIPARDIRPYLFFRHEVTVAERIEAYLDQNINRFNKHFEPSSASRSFLIFSAFTQLLRRLRRQHSILAGAEDQIEQENAVCDLQQHLLAYWALQEVEDLIMVISRCASTLTTLIASNSSVIHSEATSLVCQPCEGDPSQLGLAELVARNGPKWVASALSRGIKPKGCCPPATQHVSDLYRMHCCHGAAGVVSNRLTRMLWYVRAEMVERERLRREDAKLEKMKVTELRVNFDVWRGGSGDM